MGKRELVALLNLSSWCLVMVERLFLAVPRDCLQFVNLVFPDHTHLLFFILLLRLGKTRYHFGERILVNPRHKKLRNLPRIFDAVEKDRVSDAHGGVFVALKRDLLCTEAPELDTNCEIVWCKLNIFGSRTLYLGPFYRPPDKIDNDYLEEFNFSLGRIMSNRNAHVLIGRDPITVGNFAFLFNCTSVGRTSDCMVVLT